MRRALAALACALLVGSCGGGDSSDPARDRLAAAERTLADHPRDPRAMEAVIRAAAAGYGDHVDPVSGVPDPQARGYLARAVAAWRRYLTATHGHPRPAAAGTMVSVFGNGLHRPRDAERAAVLLTQAAPSSANYLVLVQWASKAGDRRTARFAGGSALELAEPRERERVQQVIRAYGAAPGG